MKIDPGKNKENYLNWKERVKDGIPDISKENSDILLQYINDMERGINISSKNVRGSRSFIRLRSLKDKMYFLARKFKELYNIDSVVKIEEEMLLSFFSDMKNGIIKKRGGGNYKSVDCYAKCFKAFWHWYQKVNRKKGIEIPEITLDLDTRQEKPDWVYLTEEQVKKMCEDASYYYRVLIMFLFDTGIRAPTELMNIRVSDFFNDFKELNIREEVSKTFGRRIKLMLCSQMIKEYTIKKELKGDDPLFSICPQVTNRYLKRLAVKLFGEGKSEAGGKYSELSMYDFRHCSCCYWLPRYKSESALKYRFGWKSSDKIHYYSELLGMNDTISEEDMFTDTTKTEIEKRLEKSEKEKEIIKEEISVMREQMRKIMELTNRLYTGVTITTQ
jgi:integrase